MTKIPCDIVSRPGAWFGKYDHCLLVYLPEAAVLRYPDHKKIDRILAIRQSWGHRAINRNYGGSWRTDWTPRQIDDTVKKNVHDMADWLQYRAGRFKLVISGNCLYFYTQDLSVLDELLDIPWLDQSKMHLRKLKLSGQEVGHVYLKKSSYAYRTWLRYANISDSRSQALRDFLVKQTDMRLSPSLNEWVNHTSWKNPQDYFFIDHSVVGLETMLSLIHPRLARKTQPITTYK